MACWANMPGKQISERLDNFIPSYTRDVWYRQGSIMPPFHQKMDIVFWAFHLNVLSILLIKKRKEKMYIFFNMGNQIGIFHGYSSGIFEAIVYSLIMGNFKWKLEIWQTLSAVLPYKWVSESLTDTALDGAVSVMWKKLQKKQTIKMLDILKYASNVGHHII